MKAALFFWKTLAISLSDKYKQELSANHYQNEARSYSPLTTERFQMILLCDIVLVFKLVYTYYNKQGWERQAWANSVDPDQTP